MLTGDTISEHHIDALVASLSPDGKDYSDCIAATHGQPTPIRAVYAARVRCAEILNAMSEAETSQLWNAYYAKIGYTMKDGRLVRISGSK